MGKAARRFPKLLPHLAEVVDDIAIVQVDGDRRVQSRARPGLDATPARTQFGRPCLGSWVLYGLGSEAQNLPGFVVLNSGASGPSGGDVALRQRISADRLSGRAVPQQRRPGAVSSPIPPASTTRCSGDTLDLIKELNRKHLDAIGDPGDRHAHRLVRDGVSHADQRAGADGCFEGTPETLELYGAEPGKPSFAMQLPAGAAARSSAACASCSSFTKAGTTTATSSKASRIRLARPTRRSAALIKDLKQRGLLDDTLVIWGGEFGRTPMVESNADVGRTIGRDHHPQAFTMWLAGGGIKPGVTHRRDRRIRASTSRRTESTSTTCTRRFCTCWASITTKLTYRFQGRDFRLTDSNT